MQRLAGRWVLVLCVIASSHTQAQSLLYKCTTKGKPTSYQSQPCEGAATPAKVWNVTPEPPLSNAQQLQRYNAQQKQQADSAYLSRLAGTDGSRRAPTGTSISTQQSSNNACQMAREHRDRVLYQQNLNVSNATRVALHDAVYDACK